MKQTLFSAAFLALAACASQEGGGNSLGSPIMPGQAGIGVSGQGGAGVPLGGAGGMPPGAAGMFAGGSGVSGGQPGASGTGAMAGSGGQPATGGVGAAGTMATAGAAAAGQGGMGGGGASGTGGAGGGGGSAMGMLTIRFTTVSYDGEYAPLNYGAVWFETGSGEFIKTAKRWAGATHARDLVAWTAASGGWPFLGGSPDMMDAMSSATIRTHQMHTITWDMKDIEGQTVPDGDYVAVLEMSESRSSDRAGPLIRIPFTKGASPQMAMPPAQEGFTGVSLSYE